MVDGGGGENAKSKQSSRPAFTALPPPTANSPPPWTTERPFIVLSSPGRGLFELPGDIPEMMEKKKKEKLL